MTSTHDRLMPPLWVVTLIFVACCSWLLFELKEMVTLLVVGYCIAYLFDPFLDFLEKRKISRTVGFFLILAVLLIGLVIIAITAIPTLIQDYQKLVTKLPTYTDYIKTKILPLLVNVEAYLPAHMKIDPKSVLDTVIPNINLETVGKISDHVLGALLKGYSVTLTLMNFVLLPFIVFYMAVDIDAFHRQTLALFPKNARERVRNISQTINGYVSEFVRGQLLVGFILFVLYAIGLGFIGIELWFLLALVAGFANIVPYLGLLIGIVSSTVMALFTFGDFTHVLYVWGVFIIVQVLEGTFITPKVIGDKVGIPPLVVILSIFAGGKLFGFIGIFLAVPGAAILKVLASDTHDWLITRNSAKA
ncbi:MAG: AI-2E family transporter [Deltaproteobacteria bacterium]|nr:AI-2E family transporter [Deltaproteobacteria bacterium]